MVAVTQIGYTFTLVTNRKLLKSVEYVAAINGGDGFSDIYGTDTFHSRLLETWIALKMNIPVIQLPQTLGPFQLQRNYDEARYILSHSKPYMCGMISLLPS